MRCLSSHSLHYVLTPLQAASSTYRIDLGPHAGGKVLSLQHAPRRAALLTQPLCANAHGFSLHAGVRCEADQRGELEQLGRYITRLTVRPSQDRLPTGEKWALEFLKCGSAPRVEQTSSIIRVSCGQAGQ